MFHSSLKWWEWMGPRKPLLENSTARRFKSDVQPKLLEEELGFNAAFLNSDAWTQGFANCECITVFPSKFELMAFQAHLHLIFLMVEKSFGHLCFHARKTC